MGQIGRAVLDNEPARHIVNLAYERGPPGVQNLFVRLISQAPASALEWTIELASGARVVVPVRPGDLRGWQFALSYKWHDGAAVLLEFGGAAQHRIPAEPAPWLGYQIAGEQRI